MNYGTQRHEPFRHYYGTENRKKGGKKERSLSMHSALCIASLQPLLQLIHINKSRKYQTHLMHLDASLSDAAAFIWPSMVKATKKLKTVANKLSESQI